MMDISDATSVGDKKKRFSKKGRKRHKRLHLRKTAVQPPTMQSEDKCGPKKIAEEWKQSKVRPSSKNTSQEAQHSQRRTNDSENTLRFTCSHCSDSVEYVHKDLVRHFEEKHRGIPPVFSCHTCTFNTHEFSCLQIHMLSHKDTFSSCIICKDDVQRTWSEFSAHLATCHCQNGKYSCEMCQKFTTGDVRIFLEHICEHNLCLESANDDLSHHTKDKNQCGHKQTSLHCQHCGFDASQKWLITKHIKDAHVCQNQKQKKDIHSIAMKPNDPIPKIKPRLTRSAVREMCWLTQDCLSLPGREFLDKYCHLSDPQTTLKETQQFLMKSVAGETGDQKWTKALKTVLSNVPQDVNLHPKSENGIMSNPSDLTVLTVKNKITVAQNGAMYAKRLRRMTTSDKDTVFSEGAAADAQCVVEQNGCQSNLNDNLSCPQTETKLLNDVSVLGQCETSEGIQTQENRENQELKSDQDIEEQGKKHQEPTHDDMINISSELKLTNEIAEQTSIHKVLPKRRQNRKRKRKTRCKKNAKRCSGLPLKIVLKKNPVKEKQWVSQSSLSPSEGDPADPQILQNAPPTEFHQNKRTKASKTDMCDPAEVTASVAQSNPGKDPVFDCATQPQGFESLEEMDHSMLNGSQLTDQEMQADAQKSVQFSETVVDWRNSAAKTEQSNVMAVAEVEEELCPKDVPLQASGGETDCHEPDDKKNSAADQVPPHSSYIKSSPVSQPVITAQGEENQEGLSPALSLEQINQTVEGTGLGEVPADFPDLLSRTLSPAGKAVQQEPSSAPGHRWQPVPKSQERTLKLVAINPSQLVKWPSGDQPVVVLNHPDADIPEVARIMEVINRYKGEVQKVVLSRRTLNALSVLTGKASRSCDPIEVQPYPAGLVKSSVQERFILKLKLRRLSRKKYEVVGAASPSRDVGTKFRCWFCGRVFESQEMWMVHRQRHLVDWKRPHCENSYMSHTLDEKQNNFGKL